MWNALILAVFNPFRREPALHDLLTLVLSTGTSRLSPVTCAILMADGVRWSRRGSLPGRAVVKPIRLGATSNNALKEISGNETYTHLGAYIE
jgi:hypothetical protein